MKMKEVWPTDSPDCNPLDCYERSASERTVNTVTSLKRAITTGFAAMPRREIIRACFRHRIESVVEAEGNFKE